jgi:hypothetical protein
VLLQPVLLQPVLQRPASSRGFAIPAQRYVVVGKGPPVRADEVEHAARLAIEVVVLWGGDTLCVSHFAAPSAVFLGDASGCDVALPAELLGAERRCVAVSSQGEVCAVVPDGAPGWVTLPDGSTRPFDEPAAALDRERSRPAERLLPLALGHRAHLCFASLEVQIATVRLGRKCRRVLGVDASLLASLGLSAFTVASIMTVLSLMTPTLGLNRDEQAQNTQLRLLRRYLTAAAERAAEPRREVRQEPSRGAMKPRARQAPSRDTAAEAESVAAVEPTLGLDAAPMPARDPIARRTQLEEARHFGVTGMLDWSELRDPKHRFERHMSGEELALMQRLFNPDAPVYEGPGGLALSLGIGGGGKADVVALGAVRTADQGEGGGLDRFPRPAMEAAHTPPAPLRQGESIVSDPLAAASIRRAVHAERSALLGCYADAQRSGAAVAMGAMVRFIVRGNGQIEQVSATSPSLPAHVRGCIERVFLGLSVPNPVSRPVHVAYRIALDSS